MNNLSTRNKTIDNLIQNSLFNRYGTLNENELNKLFGIARIRYDKSKYKRSAIGKKYNYSKPVWYKIQNGNVILYTINKRKVSKDLIDTYNKTIKIFNSAKN